MADPQYLLASDIFPQWQENVFSGKPPIRYAVGQGELARFTLAPKQITLIGGAPGGGKTAFVMQAIIDALGNQRDLRACIANVEMGLELLLDRQLARLSGVDLETVLMRRFNAVEVARLRQAMAALGGVAERLCFLRPPYRLDNLAQAVNEFGAHIVVVDYIQRFEPGNAQLDRRGAVDASMSRLRQFADSGRAVVVVSAVGRAKGSRGQSTYKGDNLNLASFKESGELEYACDDGYILVEDPRTPQGVILKHLKARYSEPHDIELHFDRPYQAFRPWSLQPPTAIASTPGGQRRS